jgi:hypothetical protein
MVPAAQPDMHRYAREEEKPILAHVIDPAPGGRLKNLY